MEPNELMHHGIKGQKWHVRRFQNKDGSLTVAGKKRYSTGSDSDAKAKFKDMVDKYKAKRAASKAKKEEARKAAEAAKPKSIGNMDNDELRKTIESLQLKKQAYQLQKDVSSFETKKVSKGKQFISEMAKDAVVPALKDATKEVGAKWLKKTLSKKLGLDELDELGSLKKEAEVTRLKKEIAENIKGAKKAKSDEPDKYDEAAKEATYWKNKNTADQQKAQYESRNKKPSGDSSKKDEDESTENTAKENKQAEKAAAAKAKQAAKEEERLNKYDAQQQAKKEKRQAEAAEERKQFNEWWAKEGAKKAADTNNPYTRSAGKSFIDNLMKNFNPGTDALNQLLLEDKR